MAAGFHDHTVFHNNDCIGITDCGQSVGDDKAGAVLHQSNHCLLDMHFRSCVNGRCSFIKNQNLRIGKNSACNGKKLSLTRGEIVSADTPRMFFSQNRFYTTAVSRMTRNYYDRTVTLADAIRLCLLNGKKEECL